jgi:hypothetical protein
LRIERDASHAWQGCIIVGQPFGAQATRSQTVNVHFSWKLGDGLCH